MTYFKLFIKVQELEKEIMDSREKTEFYRTKMQELVCTSSIMPF
jgi:epidermal growth factor receptor substrate 15